MRTILYNVDTHTKPELQIYTLNNCVIHIHEPHKIRIYIQTLSVTIKWLCNSKNAVVFFFPCKSPNPKKTERMKHTSKVVLAIYMLYFNSHMFSLDREHINEEFWRNISFQNLYQLSSPLLEVCILCIQHLLDLSLPVGVRVSASIGNHFIILQLCFELFLPLFFWGERQIDTEEA